MTEFSLPPYRFRVDIDASRAYYAGKPAPWVGCDCAGCRNFEAAYQTLPQSVTAFFDALGLHPAQPAEVCTYENTPSGLSYSSWYHLSGTLLEGGPAPGPHGVYGPWTALSDGVEAAFKEDCDILPDDFPRPCFQMEIFYTLPWVLDEPNPCSDSSPADSGRTEALP